MMVRRGLIGCAPILLMTASPLPQPRFPAFPFELRIGADRVYSSGPLRRSQIAPVLARANALVAASPLHHGAEGRTIVLTDGGRHWTRLAGSSRRSFALTRPHGDAVIVNRADPSADRVFNGEDPGGVRTLSGVIAHEKCHGMVRRHFGLERADRAPLWLREGYCDHVARESSLTAAQADALEAAGRYHPAVAYLRGRQKVAALLAANGGSVDKLFAAAP